MAATWYLSIYNVLNGKYTLDSYKKCSSYENAKWHQSTSAPLYPNQVYVVEMTVGSRSPMPHYTIEPRAKYSPSNTKKYRDEKMAEHNAQKLLKKMWHLSPNATNDTLRSIVIEMLVLKQHLTNKQYDTLLAQFKVLPCCIKIMSEYDLENISSKYI